MKHSVAQNSVLFYGLVAGLFFVVLAAWIPTVKTRINTLSAQMSSDKGATEQEFNAAWSGARYAISAISSTVDASVKTPTLSDTQLQALQKAITNPSAVVPANGGLPQSSEATVKVATVDDPAKKACTRNSGRFVVRKDDEGFQYNVCIFPDNTECEAQSFLAQTCAKGQYGEASEGIIKLPDLVVTVNQAGYCATKNNPPVIVDKAQAQYICLDGITVSNVGWKPSPATSVSVIGKSYSVPSLSPHASHTFSSPAYIQLLPATQTVKLEVDKDKAIEEINEENNSFVFPKE